MRVVTIDGDPWFVGKDVAGCLGYARESDSLRKNVDEDDKKGRAPIHSPFGGKQETIVSNESG